MFSNMQDTQDCDEVKCDVLNFDTSITPICDLDLRLFMDIQNSIITPGSTSVNPSTGVTTLDPGLAIRGTVIYYLGLCNKKVKFADACCLVGEQLILGIPLRLFQGCSVFELQVPPEFVNPASMIGPSGISIPTITIPFPLAVFTRGTTVEKVITLSIADCFMFASIPIDENDVDPETCEVELTFAAFQFQYRKSFSCNTRGARSSPMWAIK